MMSSYEMAANKFWCPSRRSLHEGSLRKSVWVWFRDLSNNFRDSFLMGTSAPRDPNGLSVAAGPACGDAAPQRWFWVEPQRGTDWFLSRGRDSGRGRAGRPKDQSCLPVVQVCVRVQSVVAALSTPAAYGGENACVNGVPPAPGATPPSVGRKLSPSIWALGCSAQGCFSPLSNSP